MRRRRSESLVAARKQLRREYGLSGAEVSGLVEDVCMSLVLIRADISVDFAEARWDGIRDAAQLLVRAATDLNQHELREVGLTLQQAADQGSARGVTQACSILDHVLKRFASGREH